MSIAELEQTSALRILAYLKTKKKASRTDLRRNINASTSALYNALAKLKRLNLIKEESQETFPFTVKVSLTSKGEKIAEHVEEIEKLLRKAYSSSS
ncbi:MAG TPA: hypothetical protein ENF76_02075 [Candidatus Bathyarchaeota archaeon]|nr:hypothetical protein [Candidatus Bathyarchaeota archaeon]